MTRVRSLFALFLLLAGFCLLADMALPDGALARPIKLGFIDDDWEPSEGKDGPRSDPGYEFWIMEALNLTGLDYEVIEIWPDSATEPQVPSVSDLAEYGAVLWNCAANDSMTLDSEELSILTAYLDWGGKVILCGEGIANDLVERMGDPQVDTFFSEVLGLTSVQLDGELQQLLPNPANPYFAGLPASDLSYDGLPDENAALADKLFPDTDMDVFIEGMFAGPQVLPASSNRYGTRPLHFQSFLLEAIPDVMDRAAYILAELQWLGLEGDDLYDFIFDLEDLEYDVQAPEHFLQWDAAFKRVAWATAADAPTVTRLCKPLKAREESWTIGEAFLVQESGWQSHMTLLELDGTYPLKISLYNAIMDPDHFILEFCQWNGYQWACELVENLDIQQIYRLQLSHNGVAGVSQLDVNDDWGSNVASRTLTGALDFEHLCIEAWGDGNPYALLMFGWLDDLWFDGEFDHATGAGETPAAEALRLRGAYPNPFNPSTRIAFELAEAGDVELAVHDVSGRLLRTLHAGWMDAGAQTVSWDGRGENGRALPSGVYLIRLTGREGADAAKAVLLK